MKVPKIANAMEYIDYDIITAAENYKPKKKKNVWAKWAAMAACFCICTLLGVSAWKNDMFDIKSAPNNIDSIETENMEKVQTGDGDDMPDGAVISEDSAKTVQPEQSQPAIVDPMEDGNGKKSVISIDEGFYKPFIVLTQEEVYEKTGALLPEEAPTGFAFENAGFSEYGYVVLWTKGMDELSWRIRDYEDSDAQYITSVKDTKNYDLSLYPIPRSESVPDELIQIVNDPIFSAEELTQETVKARAYKVNESGDSNGYRMNFSVLYRDKVVSVTSKGISPEWLYHQLTSLTNGD